MQLLANILLAVGATGAGIYCLVLARRLRQFSRLEDGMGGAIAVLSVQVDDLTRALKAAQTSAIASEERLAALVARADQAAGLLDVVQGLEDRRHLRVVRKRHAGQDHLTEVGHG